MSGFAPARTVKRELLFRTHHIIFHYLITPVFVTDLARDPCKTDALHGLRAKDKSNNSKY